MGIMGHILGLHRKNGNEHGNDYNWVYRDSISPLINKPLPLSRDYSRDPNMKALKQEGVY